MRMTLLRWVLLPVFSIYGLGQTPSISPPPTPPAAAHAPTALPDYAAESAVIQHLETVYTMSSDGTGSRLMTMAVKVQTDAAVRQLGVVTFAYAGSAERVEIAYVRVRRPDGTVIETPVKDAIEMPEPITREAPLYSDLKQMQLPVRSLRVGDTLEWQVKIVRTKAEAPGEFWGQENFVEDGVVLAQSLELRVPKDRAIKLWSPTIKPTETVEGTERVYRWASSQTKPTVGKEADAEKERKKKQIWTAEQELEFKEGKFPAVAWTTFPSWEAVGAWYRTLEGDRTTPDAEVKAKAAELVAGKATEEEKVRAVYGYVATQIRYIGVDFGVGRYQPHPAAEVLQNQYGDCKDKHTLLAAMLKAVGLLPDAVLIGAGVRFNEALPSPSAFNHLITTVPVDGKQVWLDSTEEVAPYRAMAYVIRDKQALVVPDVGAAQIERTPAKLPFSSFQAMDAVGTLDKEGTSNSRITLSVRGDLELILRGAFRQVSPGQYDQLVQQLSQGMGYAGTTSNPEVSRPDDTAEPMKLSYDYKREKNGDWDNYKIIPQLAPVTLYKPDEKEPPVQAIALGVPRVERSTSAMKVPDGWGVVLPEAIHAKSAYATYDETYRFEKGTLYAERKVEVLQEKVPVADWKSYKKWTDDADLGNEHFVQLTGTGVKSVQESGAPATATVDNAEAGKLVASATKAAQQNDLATARSLLDQAKALNDQQAWLWSLYGYLDFRRGEISSAIQSYEKEVSLHPESYGTYGSLEQSQMAIGRRKDAEETLRRWANAEQNNPSPSTLLISMLLEDENAAAAVKVAEDAVARLPEEKKKDEGLQVELGEAQIKAGMKEKGHATLLAVLQTTENPETMNGSAYELADAGLELPLAESTTRTALGKMTETTKAWTLDESPQTLFAKSRLLIATWDTMGWILYREGKLDEAEGYLQAAWLGDESSDVGEHLGEVEEARGKKDAALKAYELARATIPTSDMMGVRKAPGADDKRLKDRIDALRKAGAKSSISDAQKALQQMRVIPLGAANGLDGTAEYRLLLSKGSVERAEKTGARTFDGAQARMEKAQLAAFWPPGSDAKLVRGGMLNCHSGECELVLEP